MQLNQLHRRRLGNQNKIVPLHIGVPKRADVLNLPSFFRDKSEMGGVNCCHVEDKSQNYTIREEIVKVYLKNDENLTETVRNCICSSR